MSVSNFLHISENVVAAQCAHVTLDTCEENVGPSKDRKSRYYERIRRPATLFPF